MAYYCECIIPKYIQAVLVSFSSLNCIMLFYGMSFSSFDRDREKYVLMCPQENCRKHQIIASFIFIAIEGALANYFSARLKRYLYYFVL